MHSTTEKLTGAPADATILQSALGQLEHRRDDALQLVADIERRRHRMLLDNASDKDLDKIERALDRALATLERITVAEAGLRHYVRMPLR